MSMSNGSWFERLGAVSGIVGWILSFIAVGLIDPAEGEVYADPSLSSERLADLYVTNSGSGRLGAQLSLLAAFFILWFVSYLYARLRRAEGEPRWSSALVLAGGVVLVGASVLDSGFAYAASELSAEESDPVVAKFIALWTWNSASLLAPGATAVLVGSTFNGFRFGGIPRPLAIFGLVILVLTVGVGGILGAPGLAAALSGIWTFAAAVTLSWIEIRNPRPEHTDASP
jgi:hypothetical protein